MPRTRGGGLGEVTGAEVELEEGEIELGTVGGIAAGSVGRAAQRVAAVPCNFQLAERAVVVGLGKHYTRVGQQAGAADSGLVAQVLPR